LRVQGLRVSDDGSRVKGSGIRVSRFRGLLPGTSDKGLRV
jgi:hypothetical protein